MGTEITTLKQNVAGMSCCGSIAGPEQKELDSEVSQQSYYDESKTDTPYTRLQSIPEDNRTEEKAYPHINDEFDEWIKQNKLDVIKHIFIRYNMITMPISNRNNSYRRFISDNELRMHHSNLMQIATQAIDTLNEQPQYKIQVSSYDHDDEYKSNSVDTRHRTQSDTTILREDSVQLCDDSFGVFVDKYAEKIVAPLWDSKIDIAHRGHIESEEEIGNAIGFIAILHKKKQYKKKKGSGHEKEPNNKYIQKEANVIAHWVCKSYGEIEDNKYKHKVTKNDFVAELPKWIREYAQFQGFD